MHQPSLLFLAVLSLVSCSDKDEKWCDQLVLDACACEAEEESDLCQDAEVVANTDNEESCEQYYFDAIPYSCQNVPDDLGGPSLTACEQLLAEYCACEDVSESACAAYTESIEGSNADESICQSYIDAGVC